MSEIRTSKTVLGHSCALPSDGKPCPACEPPSSKQDCTCRAVCNRKGNPFPDEWSWRCKLLPYEQPHPLARAAQPPAAQSSKTEALYQILREIGECVSGHQGFVFDDVSKLLYRAAVVYQAPEPPAAQPSDQKCSCPNGSYGIKHTEQCYEAQIERLQRELRIWMDATNEWIKANGPGGWIDDLRRASQPPSDALINAVWEIADDSEEDAQTGDVTISAPGWQLLMQSLWDCGSEHQRRLRNLGWEPPVTKPARDCTHRFTVDGLRNPRDDDKCDGCGKTWKEVQDALSAPHETGETL